MSALNSGRPKENLQHCPQVVKRAGIDQLQEDIVKLIQKKYVLTSEEEAVRILNAYSTTIQNIVAKSKLPVGVKPVPVVAALPVSNSMALAHPANLSENEQRGLQSQTATEKNDGPVLYGCHNVVTNLRTVMSGSVMQLYGLNLDVDKLDLEQGLYLIDFAGNSIKITTLVRVKSTNIIFMIPGGLAAGIYKLDIRKRTCVSETIHTCLLPGFIRVVV
jgi:hypothetical protein